MADNERAFRHMQMLRGRNNRKKMKSKVEDSQETDMAEAMDLDGQPLEDVPEESTG